MLKEIIKNFYKFLADKFSFKYNVKYKTMIDGISLNFYDSIVSRMVKSVSAEINTDEYSDLKNLDLKSGDVIIDIGGNIGIVSIYLAKKYPGVKIYAFEPVLENYKNFLKNIKLNNISSDIITLEHKAVTKDGRCINMNINPVNTGGSSISDIIGQGYIRQKENSNVTSITLSNIIEKYNIENIKLLKIDCEGAEYEILQNIEPKILNKIELIRGEFHENKKLTNQFDADNLLNYTQQYVKNCKIKISRDCFIM